MGVRTFTPTTKTDHTCRYAGGAGIEAAANDFRYSGDGSEAVEPARSASDGNPLDLAVFSPDAIKPNGFERLAEMTV